MTELKSLPDLWSKTAKLNHLKKLLENQTNTVFADTKIDLALKETTARLLKIDPFAGNFIDYKSENMRVVSETRSVHLNRTLIENFRSSVKS
jgi:adenylate cyclase class IV